ncbi:histidine kinase dimerization/phospho-acceptor domain-containing protein [Planococcus sp. YIM B11945]|uniref:sensor histidine kinase n=1 Tax=Planococcus sp. YIM B11945 TaxID=3435410 RepID=UPI003D7DC296
MRKWLSLSVIALVLIGFFSMLELGSAYLGKSYANTQEFQEQFHQFKNYLLILELDPPGEEAAAPITSANIEEYRNRFGSLAEQIRSIQDQYNGDIEEAASTDNEELQNALIEERNKKIAAIRTNFSDDDVVREKIEAERKDSLSRLLVQLDNEKPVFLNSEQYFAYALTDLETGKTYKKGTLQKKPYFEEKYSSSNPLTYSENYYLNIDSEVLENYSISDGRFAGTIQVNKAGFAGTPLGQSIDQFHTAKTILYILWAATIAGLVLLFTSLKPNLKWFEFLPLYSKWQRWSIEFKFVFAFASSIFALAGSNAFFITIQFMNFIEISQMPFQLIFTFVQAFALTAISVLQIIWLVLYYRKERRIMEDIRGSFALKSFLGARQVFFNKSIGMQTLILLAVIFFWGFGTFWIIVYPHVLILWIPATLFIGLPVLFFMLNRFGYLNVLMQATENLASGRLNEELPIRGRSPLANHARQLNLLKEGVRQSMSEQAKSERLKTELITNVSHDLRTPLTSIITYTDLMKTPDLSEEERLSYAAILDRKSQRLKTLIEDLFEVSKMASGNMELQRTRLDFTQLMAQALAEHAEDIEASGLDFRVAAPEDSLYIQADGQKWWRVLDNLILNAIKYALPGTRVYITLREVGGQAEFVIKNVTRYELGENTDELFERFKRGDASRQTEGSGLGLAIAQSIVDLHGGAMKLEIDGDLFKVTVSINKIG